MGHQKGNSVGKLELGQGAGIDRIQMLNQWANLCVTWFVPQPRVHPKFPECSEQQLSEPYK